MILLEPDKIHAHLNHLNFKTPYELHYFSTIDSSNRFLNDLPPQDILRLCCAEEQTAGRGRFGRQWNSPFGENIYCSGRWRFMSNLKELSGLSLVIGLAIIDGLKKYNASETILIKWPNDLFWKHQKLGGILIELNHADHECIDITIGIGLNVNSTHSQHPLSDKPWCSLLDITGHSIDRNALIAEIIVCLESYLRRFLKSGFIAFQSTWEKVDYLKDRWITIALPHHQLSGYAKGVNKEGLLRLQDNHDTIHYLASGEATLS